MSKLNWRAIWKEVGKHYGKTGWQIIFTDEEKRVIREVVEAQLTPELIEVLNDDAEDLRE